MWEDVDLTGEGTIFKGVRNLKSGKAVAFSLGGDVFARENTEVWRRLAGTQLEAEASDVASLLDVDSFSGDAIYAVGAGGEARLFDGKSWSRLDVPTDADIERVCCAHGGDVYLSTRAKRLIWGHGGKWEVIDHVFDEFIVSMVAYQDRVYVSTVSSIYEVSGGHVMRADLGVPAMDSYGLMHANGTRLLVSCSTSAYYYEVGQWTEVFAL